MDNSAENQRAKILKHIRTNGSLTTLEAREELGIMHPGGRVMELRKQGFEIETHWINEVDTAGKEHRTGRYLFASIT